MKKIVVILCIIAFASCKKETQTPVISTDSPAATAPATDTTPVPDTTKPLEKTTEKSIQPIAAIRQRVEHINTAKLEKKHFEFMCDEKMMVDYFYEGNELVKIAIDFGTVGDVYAKEGYYYDKGKLVFNYEFVEGGPACEGCIKKNEYRTYVQNDEAIRYLKDKNVAECRTCSFSPTSRQYKLLKAKTQDEIKAVLCR
ncbi:hypothetical protein [Flavobacterium akiainvivens]|nr:hypothetical protein [Flavobacterium akiainvivens]SFQ45448.1 hypothetical protein SAMN05444144_10528 [Flavobacterium akiainvivens]